MLLIPALGLICITSLFIIATIKPAHKPAAWLLLFLLSYANIVFAGEIGSILLRLNQQWFFLLVHSLLALLGGVFWWRAGKPDLLVSLVPMRAQFTIKRVLSFAKERPDSAILSATIVLALIFSAVLIYVVPPNNNDSLRYHLARVGYWLQHGTMAPWATGMTQLIYPPVNAQLNFLWLILFTGNDRLVGFVQWVAVVFTLPGIYGIASLLGWEKKNAYFAALIYLSYPIVLLQSSSTQIDMITTALFVAVVYFFMRAFSKNEKSSLFFSALAFGLGLGTKQTFFYLVPVSGILFISVILKYKQTIFKFIGAWIIYAVLGYLVFGAYSNLINLQTFHNPFGPTETVNYITNINDPAYMIRSLGFNIPRMLYNALDTAGLPRPIDGYAHKVKAYAASYVFGLLHYNIEGTQFTFYDFPFKFFDKNQNQEDNAWFGPVSVFLLLPAIIHQFVLGIRQRDPYRISLVLMVPAFLLVQSLLWPNWSPYNGRYYAPVIATATPLIAGINWDHRKGRVLRWLVVALSVTIILVTMLYNPAKQVLGKQAKWVDIWSADRATLMTIQDYGNRDMMLMVQDRVPVQTTLGLAHTSTLNQYGLFGEGLTRRLIPIYPTRLLNDADWLDQQGIKYLLVEESPELPIVPDTFRLISQVVGWRLYERR